MRLRVCQGKSCVPGAGRDYVIRAFNQDRPYDRFIREQIAGDGYSGYGAEGRIALGFLNLTLTLEGTGPKLRRVRLTDIVDTVGSAFLGVTLQCAQCHDHKYAPIPTRDYYRMEAFFAPVILGATPVPFTQYENPEKLEEQAKEWEVLLDKRTKWREGIKTKFRKRIVQAHRLMSFQDRKDVVLPITDDDLRAAVERGILFTKEEQDLYRLVRRQEPRAFANPNHPDRYKPIAFSAREQLGGSNPMVPATYVLKNGQMEARGKLVEPGFLSAISGDSKPVDLKGAVGTRRKLLAQWISGPENPLTARVMVNRIWQHHFGKGLVDSSSDFGVNGSGTVHTELLDWLATRFIEQRWSIKAMHRLMLTSNTYRQSLRHPRLKEFETTDPENQYLWSMNTLRLEGEAIRDSILAVSGQLNPEREGPGFFPEIDDELLQRAGTWWESSSRKERSRRSIYMIQQRAFTHPFIRVFDGANANEMCAARQVTTVTPQAFALSNSKFVRDQSRFMAERIRKEAGPDLKSQVERAFQLALQRPPTSFEERTILASLNAPRSQTREQPTPAPGPSATTLVSSPPRQDHQPELAAQPESGLSPAELCLVLFNLNEFIFLE